jgi:hypothetical protein
LSQKRGEDHWINPLLTKLDLIQQKGANADPKQFWKNIEDCELLERIGRVVAEINGAAGYHVLEMLEYLPPQKRVLHVSFERNRVQHKMEILLQPDGIFLIFSSAKYGSAIWDRYFPQSLRKDNSVVVWEQVIRPSEILEENIQAWLSYLLSGLDKQFRLDQILRAATASESALSAALRKAFA